MAIKIVKPGNVDHEKWIGSCHHCKCEIECVQTDVIFEDRPCGIAYVVCPTERCHKWIPVNAKRDRLAD